MSDIQNALDKLTKAVGSLEKATNGLEADMTGQQRDMFSTRAESVSNENQSKKVVPMKLAGGVDADLLASRLDKAIAKVEKILKEA